jgi:hypothetical protein
MSGDTSTIQRAFNRDRVLEFEAEIQDLLKTLLIIKSEMDEVNEHRKQWLTNIGSSHNTGSDVFEEKIQLIKEQCELTALNFRLDILRLDGQNEIQTLNMLIEATKPLGEHESEAQREYAMKQFARQNTEELRDAMETSIGYRQELSTFMRSLDHSLKALQLQTEQERQMQEDEWRCDVAAFQKNMLDSMKKSKSSYQTIVKEYLILRHNANVAKQILSRSQNEAASARIELQKCVDHITNEASGHRKRIEQATSVELKMMTSDLRTQVVEKERILEELTKVVYEVNRSKSLNFDEIHGEIRKWEKKYEELEGKRVEDIRSAMHEVRHLRKTITSLEKKISTIQLK